MNHLKNKIISFINIGISFKLMGRFDMIFLSTHLKLKRWLEKNGFVIKRK